MKGIPDDDPKRNPYWIYIKPLGIIADRKYAKQKRNHGVRFLTVSVTVNLQLNFGVVSTVFKVNDEPEVWLLRLMEPPQETQQS